MIRAYDLRDWPEVCRVYDSSKPHELEAVGIGASFLPLSVDIVRVRQFSECECRLWEENGRVRGFVGFRRHFIGWLFVEPESFRRGIARSLLRVAINSIEGDAWLWALKGNEPALALYQREGFKRVEDRVTQNGGLPCVAIRLERAKR